MARVFSFSIPDDEVELIQILEEELKKGGWSRKIVRILKMYYFGMKGNEEQLSREYLKLLEMEKKINEALKLINEVKPELEELKATLQKKQEEIETEENLHLIRMLREVVFDEISREGFEKWASEVKFNTPENAIKARLHKFANEHKLKFPEAKKLFFKAFPELKEVLEGKL